MRQLLPVTPGQLELLLLPGQLLLPWQSQIWVVVPGAWHPPPWLQGQSEGGQTWLLGENPRWGVLGKNNSLFKKKKWISLLVLPRLLTDCLTMSVQSGATENSGLSSNHLGSSFIGGAMAPPIWERRWISFLTCKCPVFIWCSSSHVDH